MICLSFLLQMAFLALADANVNTTIAPRCIPAEPKVSSSIILNNCLPYQLPSKGFCRDRVTWKVYSSRNEQIESDASIKRFEIGAKLLQKKNKLIISKGCRLFLNDTSCYSSFPKCDDTTGKLQKQSLCRETCEASYKFCSKEVPMAIELNKLIAKYDYPFYFGIINCTLLHRRNGGEAPKCHFLRSLNSETDKLKSSECYYGNGIGYHGNVSVTRSGHVCQSWSSQCPHRHDYPLVEYPELVNASNWCRNPGGQAPNGPWCFTTNTRVRWEYCNVDKCPAPAPSLSPVVVAAFSTGPYIVFFEWRPVPLPFVHGTPRGFRIRVSTAGEQDVTINITSPESKDVDIKNLKPLTKYNFAILEFNENGDGPWSTSVDVQTMPKHFVPVRLTLILKNKTFDPFLLNRKDIRYRKLESAIKRKLKQLLQNTKAQGYNVFKINIVRFFNGSVGVELDITAELVTAPAWAATQSITGKILKGAFNDSSGALSFTSLRVEASPPPPGTIRQSDVTRTSLTIGWSSPAYSEPFNITNYTVQYKKADTKMRYYYNAVFVGSVKRKAKVGNLDSNTKYLMRVVSVNAYGRQPSQAVIVITKETSVSNKQQPIAAIASPLGVMAAVLIIVGIVLLTWWHKKRQQEKELKEKIERLRENPYDSEVNWFNLFQIDVVKPWREIPRDDLKLEDQLGSGAFGVVLKGFLKVQEDRKEHGIYCAVKMLKENPTERELRDLCKEINIMSSIGDHPNIVSLIGACTINGPPLLVVRFAPNGCLLDYLKENLPLPDYENQERDLSLKVITEKERLKFAHEIAQGMSHLEKHRYVHRDLAARNILLGKNMVAMVSDFGLSRDVYEFGVYENTAGGILPVRWMAPESLQDFTYNTTTDVWSYGVLLWEMETSGNVPYAGLQGLDILNQLSQGYRLEKSHHTSRDLYSIMWKCWNPDPKQRPTFSDLVYQVGGLLAFAGGQIDFNDKRNVNKDVFEMNQLNHNAIPNDELNKNGTGHQDIEIKA